MDKQHSQGSPEREGDAVFFLDRVPVTNVDPHNLTDQRLANFYSRYWAHPSDDPIEQRVIPPEVDEDHALLWADRIRRASQPVRCSPETETEYLNLDPVGRTLRKLEREAAEFASLQAGIRVIRLIELITRIRQREILTISGYERKNPAEQRYISRHHSQFPRTDNWQPALDQIRASIERLRTAWAESLGHADK